MRGVIVHDEMDLELARHSGLDLVEELTEFGSTATSLALRRWLVLSQCRERRTAMWCHVFCSHPSFGPAGRDASAAWWLRSSARIGTSHPRIERHELRRPDVKAHSVAHFGHEVWIVESLTVSVGCGWSPKAGQMRCTVDTDRPLARHAAGTPMDGVLRATLQCPHDRGFDAGILNRTRRPKRGSSTRRSTKRRRLPSTPQGPAWPPLPCSDRLPRRSARFALAAPAPEPSSAASSATCSARTSSLNVREASCRSAITFSVPATSSILAQRRKSNANLRLRTCGSGHRPRRIFEPKVMLLSLNAHYSTPTVGACLLLPDARSADGCAAARQTRSAQLGPASARPRFPKSHVPTVPAVTTHIWWPREAI